MSARDSGGWSPWFTRGTWTVPVASSFNQLQTERLVWRGNLQTTKTESSDRQLSMPEPLFQVLADHRDQSSFAGNEDSVFCQADGRPMDPDSLRKCGIYPALKKAGVPFRKRESGCHAFRHLAATVVHRKTGSLKLAQEQARLYARFPASWNRGHSPRLQGKVRRNESRQRREHHVLRWVHHLSGGLQSGQSGPVSRLPPDPVWFSGGVGPLSGLRPPRDRFRPKPTASRANNTKFVGGDLKSRQNPPSGEEAKVDFGKYWI